MPGTVCFSLQLEEGHALAIRSWGVEATGRVTKRATSLVNLVVTDIIEAAWFSIK